MNHRPSTMDAAANHLLDQLELRAGGSLDIAAEDASTAGLKRLILEIHEAAKRRRVSIAIDKVGERTIRLTRAS